MPSLNWARAGHNIILYNGMLYAINGVIINYDSNEVEGI